IDVVEDPDQLAPHAVSDDLKRLARILLRRRVDDRGVVLLSPIADGRLDLGDGALQRFSNPAIVEGDDRAPVRGEVTRVRLVERLANAGRGADDDHPIEVTILRQVNRARDRLTVARGDVPRLRFDASSQALRRPPRGPSIATDDAQATRRDRGAAR